MKKVSPSAMNALKEALVHIYWYKKDLISFLRQSLNNDHLINRIDDNDTKRNIVSDFVDYMTLHENRYHHNLLNLISEVAQIKDFTHLAHLEDSREKQFKARAAVDALKKYCNEKDRGDTDFEMRVAKELMQKNNAIAKSLADLKEIYFSLLIKTPQQRGYELEKIVKDLFEMFDLDPKASFKIEGEQIDGAFSFDSTDYILECKWQSNKVSPALLDVFKGKLSRKLENTLGLFISINGYSADAVALHSNSRSAIILMDGSDLMAVLEGRIALPDLISRKKRHAAQTGEIYLPVNKLMVG